MPANFEIARFRDAESAKGLLKALTESGIPCTVSSTAPAYDITAIGRGQGGDYLVVVQGEDNELLARNSLLEGDRQSFKAGLPQGYYLRTFETEELHEILRNPREWNAYDVAAAEFLLQERGEPFDPATYHLLTAESPEVIKKEKILSEGQWVLAIIISVILIKVALAIMQPTQKLIP